MGGGIGGRAPGDRPHPRAWFGRLGPAVARPRERGVGQGAGLHPRSHQPLVVPGSPGDGSEGFRRPRLAACDRDCGHDGCEGLLHRPRTDEGVQRADAMAIASRTSSLSRPEDALGRSFALSPRVFGELGGAPRSEAVSLARRHTHGLKPGACVGCFPVYAGVPVGFALNSCRFRTGQLGGGVLAHPTGLRREVASFESAPEKTLWAARSPCPRACSVRTGRVRRVLSRCRWRVGTQTAWHPGACVGCFPVYAGVLACFREDFVKGGWCGAVRYRSGGKFPSRKQLVRR